MLLRTGRQQLTVRGDDLGRDQVIDVLGLLVGIVPLLSGRKRHLLVETQGLVLRVKVHGAALQDRAAVPLLLERVWVDQGYTGSGREWIETQLYLSTS